MKRIEQALVDTDKCVENMGNNRYMLILAASARVRELRKGHMPKVATNSTPSVTALLEIETGKIGLSYVLKNV